MQGLNLIYVFYLNIKITFRYSSNGTFKLILCLKVSFTFFHSINSSPRYINLSVSEYIGGKAVVLNWNEMRNLISKSKDRISLSSKTILCFSLAIQFN